MVYTDTASGLTRSRPECLVTGHQGPGHCLSVIAYHRKMPLAELVCVDSSCGGLSDGNAMRKPNMVFSNKKVYLALKHDPSL